MEKKTVWVLTLEAGGVDLTDGARVYPTYEAASKAQDNFIDHYVESVGPDAQIDINEIEEFPAGVKVDKVDYWRGRVVAQGALTAEQQAQRDRDLYEG